MWGVFGSRKSLGIALVYDGLIAVVVTAACLAFAWAAHPGSPNLTEELLPFWISRTVDDENGGFITHFDQYGYDSGEDEKSLIKERSNVLPAAIFSPIVCT